MAKIQNKDVLDLIQKLGLELTNHNHQWSNELKKLYNKVTNSKVEQYNSNDVYSGLSNDSDISKITNEIKDCQKDVLNILIGKNTSFVRTVLEAILHNLENKSVLTK